MNLSFLTPKFTTKRIPTSRTFSLSGTMHLQVLCPESTTLQALLSEFITDLERQISTRLEIMREEAQHQLVDPFKLHSDSLLRANNFTLHMPARLMFRTLGGD